MKISIMGAGWLGAPLAKRLSLQHKIVVSKREQAHHRVLTDHGIQLLPFRLGDKLNHPILDPLFDADVLVLNIPLGRNSVQLTTNKNAMLELINHAKSSGTQKLLFISTTSVYRQSNGVIDEHSTTEPSKASGQAHVQIEACVQNQFENNATILRLAGLVAKDRHPARYLTGRSHSGGNEAVNLVHRDDVITAIESIINKAIWGHCLQLCAKEHPSRAQYYQWACQQLGLPAPTFEHDGQLVTGKIIDATHSLRLLGIELSYPSPYRMLED